MQKRLLIGAIASLGVMAAVEPARADSFSFGDYFFQGDSLANGFSSFTDDVVAYQASGPGTGFTVLLEGSGWAGEFVRQTTLIYDNGAPGSVTIDFQSPITKITGLAAQPKLFGPYIATLYAYDGATLVGASSYAGFNVGGPEGVISYFNLSAAQITSIVISATNDGAGIAIGGGQGIPEPATWALMLVGVGGLGGSIRSRRRMAGVNA